MTSAFEKLASLSPWSRSPRPGSLTAAALAESAAPQPMSPAMIRMSTPPNVVNPGVWYEEHVQLCFALQVAAVRAARDSTAEAAVGKAHAALLAHAAIFIGGAVPVLLAKDGIHTIPFERLAAARAKIKVLEEENARLRIPKGATNA